VTPASVHRIAAWRGTLRAVRCIEGEGIEMGSIGPMELMIVALIALLLFGAGRIADIGKGLGQGIKNFKQGIKDEGDADKKA
jgi:sec-independent protein translocase protein TatA